MTQSLHLSTELKMKIAKVLSVILTFFIKFRGKNHNSIVVERNNIWWDLDLNEGIDLALFLFGSFESQSRNVMKRLIQPNMIVVDVGANIGAHTLFFARSVGPEGMVYGIEPTTFAFQKLMRNLELNPTLQKQTRIFQMGFKAHSDKRNPQRLVSSWNLDRLGLAHSPLSGQLMDAGPAQFCKFDDFVIQENIEKLDFIKIDIDGYEVDFFEGAKESLRRFQPTMLVELSPCALKEQGYKLEHLLQQLKSLRYEIREETKNRPLPYDKTAIEAMIPPNGGINVIAVPLDI